jgi:hypothetical protein
LGIFKKVQSISGRSHYFHDEKKKNLLLVTTDGVMVWGAILSKGVVHLEISNRIQNAQKYRDLLIRVKPIIERTMDGLPWVFQHDHAAVYTARLVSSWLEEEILMCSSGLVCHPI